MKIEEILTNNAIIGFIKDESINNTLRSILLKQYSRYFDNDNNKSYHNLYILRHNNLFKFGYTANLKCRMHQYLSSNPSIVLENAYEVPYSKEIESIIHKKYKSIFKNEWYNEVTINRIKSVLFTFDKLCTLEIDNQFNYLYDLYIHILYIKNNPDEYLGSISIDTIEDNEDLKDILLIMKSQFKL